MRTLAIETSTQLGSVALVDRAPDGTRPFQLTLEHSAPNRHAEELLALVQRALSAAGWERQELQRIAVGIGPGSFTGLRVGLALAKGLAMGLSVPLVGIPSFAAMAHSIVRRGLVSAATPSLIVPALDARRGEVFAAAYDDQFRQRLEAFACAPQGLRAKLTELLPEQTATVVSADPSTEPDVLDPQLTASALDVGLLTFLGFEASPDPEPQYVRDADAVRPILPENPLQAAASSR